MGEMNKHHGDTTIYVEVLTSVTCIFTISPAIAKLDTDATE